MNNKKNILLTLSLIVTASVISGCRWKKTRTIKADIAIEHPIEEDIQQKAYEIKNALNSKF